MTLLEKIERLENRPNYFTVRCDPSLFDSLLAVAKAAQEVRASGRNAIGSDLDDLGEALAKLDDNLAGVLEPKP